MGAVSTLPAFLDALKVALDARSGLDGVNVFTGPVGIEMLGEECIVFAMETPTDEYEYPTVPMTQAFESYDVDGRLYTQRAGGGEDAIKEARDRAFAILEEVHDCLAASNTTTAVTQAAFGVDDARITRWTLKQRPGDHLHECVIEFNVHVKAIFTPA